MPDDNVAMGTCRISMWCLCESRRRVVKLIKVSKTWIVWQEIWPMSDGEDLKREYGKGRTPMSWFHRSKTFSNLYTFHSSILRTSMKWVQGTRLSILSHELSYPFSGMFGSESAFPSRHGPDIDVYLTQIREERELFFNLLWWLKINTHTL